MNDRNSNSPQTSPGAPLSVQRRALLQCAAGLSLGAVCTVPADAKEAKTAPTVPTLRKQIDKLFAKWDRPDAPGCALLVLKNGKIIYRRGFGMANLEYAIPNSTKTIFHVSSLSKQFTAFAIHLLAAEGALSLDDDVRKHFPELPDFGKPITIYNLLHHTSGLRDQWGLVRLAGWRFDDIITESDILDLVGRQTALNFEPGSKFLYCNTGYTLLGVIAKRTAGKSLRQFTQERIFTPLGMTHTFFHDDYQEIVPHRAYSYQPKESSGYQNSILSYSNVGATSLFTTADDLSRWDQNFYNARVGGPAVIAAMLKRGALNDGKQIEYASGLEIRKYRNLNLVEHNGEDAGFRADLLRFPEQRVSIIMLGNVSEMNEENLVRQVADVVLALDLEPRLSRPATPVVTKPTKIELSSDSLDAFVGDYEVRPGFFFMITKEKGQLVFAASGKDKFRMTPSSPLDFFMDGPSATVTFTQAMDGTTSGMILHEDGSDIPAKRKPRPAPSPEQLRDYAGDYYSKELRTLYTISIRDKDLWLRYPRGEWLLQTTQLDEFIAPDHSPFGRILYARDAKGAVTGFGINNGRVRNLQFSKIAL